MQHIRLLGAAKAGEGGESRKVEGMRVAPHRNTGDAERQPGAQLLERLGGALTTG